MPLQELQAFLPMSQAALRRNPVHIQVQKALRLKKHIGRLVNAFLQGKGLAAEC